MTESKSLQQQGIYQSSPQTSTLLSDTHVVIPHILLDGDPLSATPVAAMPAMTTDTATSAIHTHRVAIAVDPIALITTECITVTSAMRKHARWSPSSVSAILGGTPATSYRPAAAGAVGVRHRRGEKRAAGKEVTTAATTTSAADDEESSVLRWGFRGKRGKSMKDNPLMSAFARLRSHLRGCQDVRKFDLPSLLHPFLQVIRSSSTSAPITSLALVAITKFFAYDLITRESMRLSLGMQLLSAAITHCRFEASDSAADEIVLLRILKLMEGMLSGPGGDLLGDESVCEMMETGLSMCCQMRLSELLRRSAEMSMVTMCQAVFERLKHLDDEAAGAASEEPADGPDSSNLKMVSPLIGTNVAFPHSQEIQLESPDRRKSNEMLKEGSRDRDRRSPSLDQNRSSNESDEKSVAQDATESMQGPGDHIASGADIKPYSLPSIRELFRVLVNLLDPQDRKHTDTMRIMALRIIDVALEVAGPSIAKHGSLASLARDHLCRHLFQLVRSDNMNLLNESLRVTGTLLATCRSVMKLQQELFVTYLIACLHPRVEIPLEPGIDPELYHDVPHGPGITKQPGVAPAPERQKLGMEGGQRKPDAREAMVESIGALARIPTFLAELFVNYDCEVDRSDLCEDLIGLLSRNAFPDSATWSTTNVPPLCLDALLGYVSQLADRLDEEPVSESLPDPIALRQQRLRKKVIIEGTLKYNDQPKAGIAYLAAHGIVQNPNDPHCIVKFLKGSSRISKKTLGDYISKKSNEHLLQAFMDTFDFTGKRVDEALRDLLGSFRLPGESALIERIVTVFSENYCATSTPDGIADKDAVFVLTYAIIMLNTDLYNPNVKPQNRMTMAAFSKNLGGVNDGKDFAPEYLKDIYDAIKSNEIILPDEHDNQHAFDYAWKELLLKAQTAGDLALCPTNIFDADMFAATWKPVVATMAYVFMSATEDTVYQRIVDGFDQCARIAAKHGLTEALDRIVHCLSVISTLASASPPKTSLNTEIQAGGNSVMVSELAVKFGRDYRAQLATVVLFKGVICQHESNIRDGWKQITRIWLNLFANSLLPAAIPRFKELLDTPPIPMQNPSQVINRERSSENGLFQSFTSYLSSYAADDPPEPSDEEINDTLCTIDCLQACPMDTIFSNILSVQALPGGVANLASDLSADSLTALVQEFLSHLPEDSMPVLTVVKPETLPSSPKLNGHRMSHVPANYHPSTVYILELITMLAIRDEKSAQLVGKDVAEVLQNVVRGAAHQHALVVSRAVFCLLNLLRASYDFNFIRSPVVLHSISSLDQTTKKQCAQSILRGFSICLAGPRPVKHEIINSPDFWAVLRDMHGMQDSAAAVFEILQGIMEESPSAIKSDNYEAVIYLANDFATAGSAGAIAEQKRDRHGRRSKSANPDNDVVNRGIKAVNMIYHMGSRASGLIEQSHLERHEAWSAYWSPIFRALSTQCINPCREIRHQAFISLQRSLLAPELASANHQEWTAIFGEVLFPLILQLLKPEVYHSDPVGMSETRVRAATLLCRIFLHYLVLLSEWDGMLQLWIRILDIMDRLMNSGQGDSLEEAVPESLKNVLLVMANGGYLVPSSNDDSERRLWLETTQRLDRLLPGLMAEIFPADTALLPITTTSAEQTDTGAASQVAVSGSAATEMGSTVPPA